MLKRDATLPIMLVAMGVVWLLFNLDWIPSFDWVVTLILVGAGIAILVLEGINRKSIVGGPLLIAIGLAWLLHFHFGVRWRYLGPGLCIAAGFFMLIARSDRIPERRSNGTVSDSTNQPLGAADPMGSGPQRIADQRSSDPLPDQPSSGPNRNGPT